MMAGPYDHLNDRTDRVARRVFVVPPARDTYCWTDLRARLAARDTIRGMRRVGRHIRRAGISAAQASEAMQRFGRALRNEP